MDVDSQVQMELSGESFQKLCWICIRDYKMLFVRKFGGDMFFDPGCRRVLLTPEEVGGLSEYDKREKQRLKDEQVLVEKIREELEIEPGPLFNMNSFSFSAQAYGKPEGVMVSAYCLMGEFKGVLRPTKFIEEIAWFSSADRKKTTDLGNALLQKLRNEGLVYR